MKMSFSEVIIKNSTLTQPGRGRNKGGGPQTICPQNLVKAHIMLRPRAKMALEKCWLISISDV